MNRQLFFFLFAIAIPFSVSPDVVCAQSGTTGDTRIEKERVHRAIKFDMARSPIGINAGLIVAYGHPLRQPYHFEYRGQRLFVNGVQVDPSLVQQRDHEKNYREMAQRDVNEYKQLQDLTQQVRKLYFDQLGKTPSVELHDKILRIVKAHVLIKDAEWRTDTMLLYRAKGQYERVATAINFRATPIRRQPNNPKTTEQLHSDRIKEFESRLRAGDCIIFLSDGGTWFGKDVRGDVNRVMNHPGLSPAEKEKRLFEIFGNASGPSLDTIANYNKSEWE